MCLDATSFSCAQSGRAAVLLGVPALSCLGYEAYHRVQSSALVHALGKGSLFVFWVQNTKGIPNQLCHQ